MSYTVTGTVGDGPIVEGIAAHRRFSATPVAVQVTLSVPMGLDDLTAVLWLLVDGGYDLSEVLSADPAGLSALIVDSLCNETTAAIEHAALTVAELPAGSVAHQVAGQLRALVTRHYAPTTPAPRRDPRAADLVDLDALTHR